MAKSALDKLMSKTKLKPKTLVGKQKNLDVNKNNKIDAQDLKMLRKDKMADGGNVNNNLHHKLVSSSLWMNGTRFDFSEPKNPYLEVFFNNNEPIQELSWLAKNQNDPFADDIDSDIEEYGYRINRDKKHDRSGRNMDLYIEKIEDDKMAKGGETKKEYLFNFVGGGWNSIVAKNKYEAIKLAKAKFNDDKSKVDEKSFRIKTEKDYKNLLSMFYEKGGKSQGKVIAKVYVNDERSTVDIIDYEIESNNLTKITRELNKLQKEVSKDELFIQAEFELNGEKYSYLDGYVNKMAKGGKTQGYDDKEDERLAMKDGKISSKDLKNTRARRDDARFEERMAEGGETYDKAQFKKELAEFKKHIKEGYGWISPEYVRETWENMNFKTNINNVNSSATQDLYKDLIESNMLWFPEEGDDDEKGERVKTFKDLYGWNYGENVEYAKGGTLAQENNDMLQSNIKEIKHHSDELDNIVTNSTEVEPWVIAKTERASTDLSDVTHYLDGLKDKSLEMPFEKGGYMAKGGKNTNSWQRYLELSSERAFAGGGNGANIIDYGLSEVAMYIDQEQYSPETRNLFVKLVDSMVNDEIKNNQVGANDYEKGGYMAEGGEIEDQYKNLSAEEIWSMWNEKQRKHFIRDHRHDFPEILDSGFILAKKDFKKLPARVQIAVEFHTEDGEYAMGGKLSSSSMERMNGLVPVGMMREFQKTGMVLRKYLKHDGFDDKDVTKYLCSKITNEYSQGGEIDSEKYEAVQTINQLKSAVATNSNIETDKKVFIDGRLSNIMRLVDKAYAGLEEHEDVKKLYFYIDSATENIDEIQKELVSSKSELNIESDYINKKLEDLYDLVSNMGFNIEMENED